MKFEPFKDNFSLPEAEEKILEFWDRERIFEKTTVLIKDRPHFVFYEGPPTANGRPGAHHVVARTVKDLICRYKVMRGYRVDRKAGWDTHGLPVEIEVEKALQLDTKNKVIEYGVAKFNQKCRESVFKYLDDWNQITRRIGYWLDLDDAYVTLTNDYIETVWWILKNFFDRDLIYKGYKTIPYCPRCGTGLSSHEVAQGYMEVRDPSVFIKVKAADDDFSYLVWTTTPWTLPSNAALCMKPDATYVMVEHEGEKLVLAEALIPKVFGENKEIRSRFTGKDFLKRKYVPIFDFYKSFNDRAFYVINADFVTMEDGTGIVHIAPGFGADDYEVGSQYGLPVLQAIESNGIFKELAGPYAGKFIKDADPVIIRDLKTTGKLFKKELYEHNYPFCWRCDTPLIYITRESWYIKTTRFKEQLIRNNNSINWYPDEIRTGRMLNWLENNVDWALSRERFWGTPLPVWICDDGKCGHKKAVGSVEQLRREGRNVPEKLDLHKPYIDEIKLTCDKCGYTMTRVPELIDVWFDSGSMPYAQWHYPFENKEMFEIKYPAEFISEAVDQTRGWFYSLLAISTMLFDKAPFKNVLVLEFVLDKEGKKMSKHKGNVIDPFTIADTYGADPLRWYLLAMANPWLPKRFDFDGLTEVIRKYFDTLRNTYSFLAIYANIDRIVERAGKEKTTIEEFLKKKAGSPEQFDLWIMSRYHSLLKEVTNCLDNYDITRSVRALQNFVIEDLSNWYVRNNRRRYWAKEDDPSKMRAYYVLYHILEGLCRMSAPITPFISELIWRELMGHANGSLNIPLSVHMAAYPQYDENLIDLPLEEKMDLARRIVSLGRAARSRKNLKVRQPLSQLLVSVPGRDGLDKLAEYTDIIKDELNIKEIIPAPELDSYVTYSSKLNFKNAGPKLGNAVKDAAARISRFSHDEVKQFVLTNEFIFETGGKKFILTPDEIEVNKQEKEGYAVENDGPLTVALVTELTVDLIDEGFARELVNKIQNMRKTTGLEVTDHITIRMHAPEAVKKAAERYNDFIRSETLAQQIEFLESDTFDGSTMWNINGEKTALAVAKI
ncbi:MAG: isoleucine--tRNA ligase [candidate division Zixibacteria bacterium]|nr:isoleucine--tRNA ligase [candidate division Zixibacteria bacterium]